MPESRFAEVRVEAGVLAHLLMPGVDATIACARFDYSKMQVVLQVLGRDVPAGGYATVIVTQTIDEKTGVKLTAKLEAIPPPPPPRSFPID